VYEWLARQPEYENKLLPNLTVMVLYHGSERWTAPLNFGGLVQPLADPCVKPVDFDYVLVDINHPQDAEKADHPVLRAGLLALWLASRPDKADKELTRVLTALVGAPLIQDETLMLLASHSGKDTKLWYEAGRLMPEKKDTMITIAEQLRLEGHAKGKAEGLEEGLAKGKEEGLAEGLVKGTANGKATMITSMLCQRFGRVPNKVKERILQAPEVHLDAWGRRIFDAKSIKDVLAGY
jgi:predicted transposase YdaD